MLPVPFAPADCRTLGRQRNERPASLKLAPRGGAGWLLSLLVAPVVGSILGTWRTAWVSFSSLIRLKVVRAADTDTQTASFNPLTSMFRHRQELRQWAARVLVLWLFGIGAGIANACITTGQVAPVAAVASHRVAVVEAHHDVVTHGHAQADGAGLPSQTDDAPTHLGNLSKANCQDFCNKAAVSIPPLKSALDDIQAHAAIAATAVTVLPMPAFASVQRWVPRRDGVQAPPILFAFLRLAL